MDRPASAAYGTWPLLSVPNQGLVPDTEAAEDGVGGDAMGGSRRAYEEDAVDSSDDGDGGTATPRLPSAPVVAAAATRTLKRTRRARCCTSASTAPAREPAHSTSKLPMSPDTGGCDIQKQEIQEAIELPLTQHELYCSMQDHAC